MFPFRHCVRCLDFLNGEASIASSSASVPPPWQIVLSTQTVVLPPENDSDDSMVVLALLIQLLDLEVKHLSSAPIFVLHIGTAQVKKFGSALGATVVSPGPKSTPDLSATIRDVVAARLVGCVRLFDLFRGGSSAPSVGAISAGNPVRYLPRRPSAACPMQLLKVYLASVGELHF